MEVFKKILFMKGKGDERGCLERSVEKFVSFSLTRVETHAA